MSRIGTGAAEAPVARDDAEHLQLLVAEWGMLADFCFADLLLFVPAPPGGFTVAGQVRPSTSQTVHHWDWVGTTVGAERPLVERAWSEGRVVEGDEGELRVQAHPVRHGGRMVGVMTREWSPSAGRQPGELERTYLDIFDRFASMIADGTFPYRGEADEAGSSPRVGDGVLLVDDAGTVGYASPNAVSALHRAGVRVAVIGRRLAELGLDDGGLRVALATQEPVATELDPAPELTLLVRCLPFLADGRATGAVLLVRDVSDLRLRDRLLVTKDATIREIHHRVKNNLQTISSLLNLQARRLSAPEAKAAVEESVRRIRTIALVHETLALASTDDVPFGGILRPLARLVEEGLVGPERAVRIRVEGDPGDLPSAVATPLAVVLVELLQNAVEHGFPGGRSGEVRVELEVPSRRGPLLVRVLDDGVGVHPGFRIDRAAGLGLTIVRTLVTGELGGTIGVRPRDDGPGTVVELVVPLDGERPGAQPRRA